MRVHAIHNRSADDFLGLSHVIFRYANTDSTRVSFLRQITNELLNFYRCDAVELRLWLSNGSTDFEYARRTRRSYQFKIVSGQKAENDVVSQLRSKVADRRSAAQRTFVTSQGSLSDIDANASRSAPVRANGRQEAVIFRRRGGYRSIADIPIVVGDDEIGNLRLVSRRSGFIEQREVKLYQRLSQSLGLAILAQRSQAALRERIKELACLYSIAQVVEIQGLSLEELLRRIAMLLPVAWQYPEVASARIVLDGLSHTTPDFPNRGQRQRADIKVRGVHRGIVEVMYTGKNPRIDEGPFLEEERNLIDAVAKQVALIIERREAEQDSEQLQEQLRHADRLATIGQLAAGIAHELNEPIGHILGAAQLAKKVSDVPDQVGQDINQILTDSLRAREIIRNLLTFARQAPSKETRFDLNQLMEEALSFFEPQCKKCGITLARSFSTDLPPITADQGQVKQVVVNLVVNAMQAMPRGGTLTLRTQAGKGRVSLLVEDTGAGMSTEVKKHIFLPFFTTKEPGKGTGLGLAVVHGIVASHGGDVKVVSKEGAGARFEVILPVTKTPPEKERDRNGSFRR